MNDIKLTELLGIKDIEITKTEIDTVGHFLIYVKTKTKRDSLPKMWSKNREMPWCCR